MPASEHVGANALTVSIIIPFLDAERYLEDAIASVCAQSWPDWELLLVDDGSRDGSRAIAIAAASADVRIRLLSRPSQGKSGAAAARNVGLNAASGEFIAFLDADDVFESDKLSSQLAEFARHPEVMMVYGPTTWWNPDGDHDDWSDNMRTEWRRSHRPPRLFNRVLMMQRGPVPCTCAVLIRRYALDVVGGFDESFDLYEDQTLWAKLMLRFPVYVSETLTSRYRQHAESTTARSESAGTYDRRGPHRARVAFLEWASYHARQSGLSCPSVERAIRVAFAPYGGKLTLGDRATLVAFSVQDRARSLAAKAKEASVQRISISSSLSRRARLRRWGR